MAPGSAATDCHDPSSRGNVASSRFSAPASAPWVAALAPRLAREPEARQAAVRQLATASLIALLVASILSMSARTYNPFIYFRF
jgi:hypothetical protein